MFVHQKSYYRPDIIAKDSDSLLLDKVKNVWCVMNL